MFFQAPIVIAAEADPQLPFRDRINCLICKEDILLEDLCFVPTAATSITEIAWSLGTERDQGVQLAGARMRSDCGLLPR